ncbi:Sapep family Mn(2+)-dependent dipeptidase [Adlercreutzia sp. R21]|uniref:Sapep family Mn(2+)-dependent dipeptidase n=1 Tax=Adlercreutzia wanghongyangiae TaxID=3111451 RepID=UPI002DBA86BA|nr:Sapep family Mn(2+)-dependent dipeptidase [Adlercreutzia sp. R21]MEC4185318.1 Sapep family Mn(2+)-dependent dipeptidase [Adlercreutzia sp. R21]
MQREEIISAAEAYWDENRDAIVADIAKLVEIPSTEDLAAAAPGAPYGPGPAAALEKALEIAEGMGMAATNCEGHIGFADLPGETDIQLGIIGHMDVVPAGPGWSFDPFKVTEKDGFLMGRGCLDDKGPSVVALHAVKCLAGLDVPRPYTIRFLFGANEETSMADVAWYLENYESSEFIFTPDADFPVCYGEKGGYDGCITSAPIVDPVILDISGGVVTNAVPGEAWALVRADASALPAAERITVEDAGDGTARIDATGVNAHAAWPERGISAIMLLTNYLLENGLCNQQEREFLELVRSLVSDTTGAGVGIATADEYFGPLTVVGGTIRKEGDCLVQTLDSRWPTSITADEITAALTKLADAIGATFENTLLMVPFLVKPEDPEIQVLQDAFQAVTGDTDHAPFTIGGGTYAREFKKGASFGINMPWIETPAWVGGEHAPDEGVAEDLLRTSFVIYVLALAELQTLKIS